MTKARKDQPESIRLRNLFLDSKKRMKELDVIYSDDPYDINNPLDLVMDCAPKDREVVAFILAQFCIHCNTSIDYNTCLDIMSRFLPSENILEWIRDGRYRDIAMEYRRRPKYHSRIGNQNIIKLDGLLALYDRIRSVYSHNDSIYALVIESFNERMIYQNIADIYYGLPFIPSSEGNTPCRRINLFIMWMYKSGLWHFDNDSKLIVPLDKNFLVSARKLHITERKELDIRSAILISDTIRKMKMDIYKAYRLIVSYTRVRNAKDAVRIAKHNNKTRISKKKNSRTRPHG